MSQSSFMRNASRGGPLILIRIGRSGVARRERPPHRFATLCCHQARDLACTRAHRPQCSLGSGTGHRAAIDRQRESPMPTLRELRADRLLSIRELAERAGVAPSSIYLIEVGRVTPRVSMMRRLATALDVDPEAVAEFRQAMAAAMEPPPSRGQTAQDWPRAPRA